ncbi:hypothetical protein [Embleya sp. NPDC005971]
MCDHLLGGSTNFDADRVAAEAASASVPTLGVSAR